MNYKNLEKIPAVVVVDNDPLHMLRIKVNAPSLFDSSVMDEDDLPWVYPASGGRNSFSSPRKNDKVWLLNDKSNYNAFWYEPFFSMDKHAKEIAESDSEVEVLVSRDCGGKHVDIFYDSLNGLIIRNGDDSTITISNDNQLTMKCGDTGVKIANNQVYLGNDDLNYQMAVKGDVLKSVLETIGGAFNQLADTCERDGHLMPLKAVLASTSSNISKGIQKLLSTNTLLN